MTDLHDHLGELSPEQRELFALLHNQQDGNSTATERPFRLTFAQERIWFIEQTSPGNLAYNLPFAFRIAGPLAVEALESALNYVVRKHEALRATIVFHNQAPNQVIKPLLRIPLELTDIRDVPPERRESEALNLVTADLRIPFDLESGPLLRARLLQLDTLEHLFLLTVHHCVFDGPSVAIFLNDLSGAYEDCRAGREPQLPAGALSYSGLVQSENDAMSSDVLAGHLDFWKAQLKGALPFLDLPADRQRPPALTFRGAHFEFAIPEELSDAVRNLARAEGVTLFMALLAAYQSVLFRYTQQEEIVVGTATANRNRLDSDNVVGFFASSIPLRTSFAGDPTFVELLHRVRNMAADAYAHEETPFEKIVATMQSPRDASRNPIFQHMFLLHGKVMEDLFTLPQLTVSRYIVPSETSRVDLTLSVSDGRRELLAEIDYSTDLFDSSTIARFSTHYINFLRAAVRQPDGRVSQLPILSESERHQLIFEWNATGSEFPGDQCIHALFEEQVEKTPDAVAVEFGDRQWTYREINSRANQVSHCLHARGIRPELPVGFCIERSAEMIIGLLAILKSGGCYVPLDAAWPPDRLASILREAQAPLLLTTASLQSRFEKAQTTLFCIDSEGATIDREEDSNLNAGVAPENLAYISFTSGSTGRPKGVCVPHRAVVRLVRNTNYARLTAGEVFLQLAPLAFDASTFEIWGALLNGAKLAVCPAQPPSLVELGDVLRKHRVTTLWLTAGLFHQMTELRIGDLRGIRQLLSGGDVLSVARVREMLEALPDCALINGYGPTENTTFTCCHRITAAPPGHSIPIGKPINNTTVYIVDRHMQPVPIGVPGELCTGGAGLARGYLRSPELEAEKFIPNPFSREPGAKLYRTGDLARRLADGTIEFLGRMDLQVKIRGHRVEVGEIEAVLHSHPKIKDCAVIARPGLTGEKLLVAYVVPKEGSELTANDCRHFLAPKLPDYLIPSAFSLLDVLPLTTNGKLDRQALATSTIESHPPQDCIPPQDSVQAQLIEIWEGVLHRHPIGIRDDFFTLGGHSLLGARLLAIVEERLGIRLPFGAFFSEATIERMASLLKERQSLSAADHSWVMLNEAGTKAPLFFLHGDYSGGGFFCRSLARYSGEDRPFCAMHPAGLHGDPVPTTIEEMAALKLQDLRKIQPEGPYLLGGYCNGALVAFEMARRIEAEGGKVPIVLMLVAIGSNVQLRHLKRVAGFVGSLRLENPADRQRRFLRWRKTARFLGGMRDHYLKAASDLIKRPLAEQVRRVVHKMRRVLKRLLGMMPAPPMKPAGNPNVHIQQSESEKAKGDAYMEAIGGYVPKRFGGRVILIWPQDEKNGPPEGPTCGWTEVCNDVRVVLVPGEHDSCIERELNLRIIGEQMAAALAEIERHGNTGA